MQDQLQQALQQQLRDVHLPEQVGWWPLAPAWWILAAIVIATIVASVFYLRHRRRKNQYRKAALIELERYFKKWQSNGDSAGYLQGANLTLKRCLRHTSVEHISTEPSGLTLTGSAWVTHLNRYISQKLSTKTEFALGEACYQAEPNVEIELVNTEVSRWIRSHHHTALRIDQARAPVTEVTHA